MAGKQSVKVPRPTDAELAILRVLWREGPSPVRKVMEALNAERGEPLAYTTALKFLQIMTEKGLVTRDEADRSHVYHPAAPAEKTRRLLVRDLIDRAFDGSARALVAQALGSGKISRRELGEIKALIDQLGGDA